MASDAFSSVDAVTIDKAAQAIINNKIAALSADAKLPQKAVDLYFKTPEILESQDAEQKLISAFSGMDDEEKSAFAHMRLVSHLLTTGSGIIAHRNNQNLPENDHYNIENMLELAHEAGYTDENLENFFTDIRIWKSITPHPTEHLNSEGIALFRTLIAAGEMEEDHRAAAISNIVDKMLTTHITPIRPATTFEETDSAAEQSRIYRQGQREMFRRINTAVNNTFGDFIIQPNLKRDEANPDIGLRTWHGGGDADGKPNADRWALMYGMLTFTKEAIEDHLKDINKAEEAIKTGSANTLCKEWERAAKPFTHVKEALQQLQGRINHLERRFVQTDPNGANKKLKPDVDYDAIKTDFSNLYVGLKMGEQTFESQRSFVRQLDNHFKHFAQNIKNPEAREIMAESHFLLTQYGLSSVIIETRHNGLVYQDTINNIFEDAQFRADIKLTPDQNSALSAAGKFTNLDSDVQTKLLEQAKSALSADALKEVFIRANPFGKDENGYVHQTHEIFERFELMSVYPEQFSMGIIAEADGMSASYQRFFAEPSGVKTLLHTPLNEEYETLQQISDFLEQDHLNGGKHDIHVRALQTTSIVPDWYGHSLVQGQMLPCSDSGKELGPCANLLQTAKIREVTARSVAMGMATLIKRGNGMSLERGGGDEMFYTRLIAQILEEQAERRGTPLNPDDPQDRVLLQMASFFSNTEQGRAIRIMSGTSAQVADDLCNKVGEMLGRRMELEGLLKKGTMIPPRGVYSPKTDKFLNETADAMMRRYSDFRNAQNIKGDNKNVDLWAQVTSNPSMAGAANSSARPQSKSTGSKAALLTKQRAIGSNIWNAFARSNQDGYFTCGEFMERLHKNYNQGKLSQADVEQFTLKSQWWRRNFFQRALIAAVRSGMKHGFDRLGANDMTFDRAIEIGRTARVENGVFKFDDPTEKVTEGQALQAAFFYDQAVFAALTEAGLGINKLDSTGRSAFDKPLSELLKTVRPSDNSVHINYGSKTFERWPNLIDNLRAARNTLPELVLTDLYEEQIKEGHKIEEGTKRLIVSAARSGTIPSTDMIFEPHSYGRRREPINPDRELTNPTRSSRPEISSEHLDL